MCPVLCEFDDVKRWEEPTEWRKANPMIGVGVPESYYADATRDVVRRKTWLLAEHLRLMGAQWTQAKDGWLDLTQWTQAVEDDTLTLEDFRGKFLYFALDLSRVNDLSAYVAFAEDGETDAGEEKYIGMLRAFTCEGQGGLVAKAEKDGMAYEAHAEAGHLVVCPGPLIDYDVIADDMATTLALGDGGALCYDSRYKSEFDKAAVDHLPADLPQQSHPQTPQANANKEDQLNMDRSIRQAEALVTAGRLRFMPNPLMRVALGGAKIEVRQGGFRCFGRPPGVKYDPAVCLAMCAGFVHLPGVAPGANPIRGMNAAQLLDWMYKSQPKVAA